MGWWLDKRLISVYQAPMSLEAGGLRVLCHNRRFLSVWHLLGRRSL
jgi:hypothetical protein